MLNAAEAENQPSALADNRLPAESISDITKAESDNCFIIHCFKEINDKCISQPNTVYFR